jgi:hypothetical protein
MTARGFSPGQRGGSAGKQLPERSQKTVVSLASANLDPDPNPHVFGKSGSGSKSARFWQIWIRIQIRTLCVCTFATFLVPGPKTYVHDALGAGPLRAGIGRWPRAV